MSEFAIRVVLGLDDVADGGEGGVVGEEGGARRAEFMLQMYSGPQPRASRYYSAVLRRSLQPQPTYPAEYCKLDTSPMYFHFNTALNCTYSFPTKYLRCSSPPITSSPVTVLLLRTSIVLTTHGC